MKIEVKSLDQLKGQKQCMHCGVFGATMRTSRHGKEAWFHPICHRAHRLDLIDVTRKVGGEQAVYESRRDRRTKKNERVRRLEHEATVARLKTESDKLRSHIADLQARHAVKEATHASGLQATSDSLHSDLAEVEGIDMAAFAVEAHAQRRRLLDHAIANLLDAKTMKAVPFLFSDAEVAEVEAAQAKLVDAPALELMAQGESVNKLLGPLLSPIDP